MNRLLRWLVAAAVPLLLHAAPAMSAVELFLKIDDIKGESTDFNHRDWIDLLSYSFGASNSGSLVGGGRGGAGNVQLQDFYFTKYVDASSPFLFQGVASGKHYAEAVVEILAPLGNGGGQLVTYTLGDVLVTSFSQSGGGGIPVDSFSLAFGKLKVDDQIIQVPVPVPEPSTWALLIAGLAFVAWRGHRQVQLRPSRTPLRKATL